MNFTTGLAFSRLILGLAAIFAAVAYVFIVIAVIVENLHFTRKIFENRSIGEDTNKNFRLTF